MHVKLLSTHLTLFNESYASCGLLEETKVHRENPHRHKEYTQTLASFCSGLCPSLAFVKKLHYTLHFLCHKKLNTCETIVLRVCMGKCVYIIVFVLN